MKFKRLVLNIGEFNDSQEMMEEMKDLLKQGLDSVRRGFDNSFEIDNDKDGVEFAEVQETEGAERFDHKTTDVLDPDNYAINTEGGERFDTFTESEDQRKNFLTLDVEEVGRNMNNSRVIANSEFRVTENQQSKRRKTQEDDNSYRAKRVADCVMALILCHNVTPVIQKKKKVKGSSNRLMENPSGEESSLYSGDDE